MIERPYCQHLGLPFSHTLGPEGLSASALAAPPPYTRARAVCILNATARHIVHRFKYEDSPELGRMMARWMGRAGSALLEEADLIIPVPLHPIRLWQRRYNQAAILAHHIAREHKIPVELALLLRQRRTSQQAHLSYKERQRNVQGAFQLRSSQRSYLLKRRVLLIDDVITTGATVEACTCTLLQAGAQQVDVLVFARAVLEGQEILPV